MPAASLFTGFDHYYATLAHEMSHWTGHHSRLGRDLKNRFGSAAYAAEELIAELSSAMLGAELGLPVAHLDSHASYIEHWLKLLKDDDRAILTAAARAEEAASLLLKLGGRTALAGDGDDISDALGDDTADALAA
jgi:antirestriction protein ArdC